jgi:hypothetical protein
MQRAEAALASQMSLLSALCLGLCGLGGAPFRLRSFFRFCCLQLSLAPRCVSMFPFLAPLVLDGTGLLCKHVPASPRLLEYFGFNARRNPVLGDRLLQMLKRVLVDCIQQRSLGKFLLLIGLSQKLVGIRLAVRARLACSPQREEQEEEEGHATDNDWQSKQGDLHRYLADAHKGPTGRV